MKDPVGYGGLLNLEPQPHWTVFLSDFQLQPADILRLKRQLAGCATRPLFIRIDDGVSSVMRKLIAAGVDPQNDYVSLQGLVFRHSNTFLLDALYQEIPKRDLARVELPLPECGFRPSFAGRLIEVISQADYEEQERVSDRFFTLLARQKPYRVMVVTKGCKLEVRDTQPWFDIAGRLQDGEIRILPAGEVAYTADRVDGEFVIDGAVLPLPEHPDVAKEALRLGRLSREVRRHPIRLEIRDARVVGVSGSGRPAEIISKLLEHEERYRDVTEVGISFNRASRRFIHKWPAASNEVRPGVHIAIGGDPTPDDNSPPDVLLVHIDCMAANCRVFVNDQPFLLSS